MMTYIEILLAFAGLFIGAVHWYEPDVPMCIECSGLGYHMKRIPLHGDQTGRGTEIRCVCPVCHGERWCEDKASIVWRP